MNFELELLTTAILVSSVLHIKVEYNGDQHSGNPYYERTGLGATSAVGTSANIICCVRRDFILNFRRNAGLESISDEIQIRTVFYPEHLLCRTVGNSNLNEPGHVQSVVLKMGVIKKLLNNYRFLLQDLREGHTLLFVMHVFFVGGAVLTLLLVLLFSGFRLLF